MYKQTINKILKRLSAQVPFVENGDIIETFKTVYPECNNGNIVLEGIEMTAPLTCSKEWKKLLIKEESPLLKIYKELNRGDLLKVNKIINNKVFVENISISEEYRKEFCIDKIDIVKKNFNVVKRVSVDLLNSLQKLNS